jgi:hypothetical protein
MQSMSTFAHTAAHQVLDAAMVPLQRLLQPQRLLTAEHPQHPGAAGQAAQGGSIQKEQDAGKDCIWEHTQGTQAQVHSMAACICHGWRTGERPAAGPLCCTSSRYEHLLPHRELRAALLP